MATLAKSIELGEATDAAVNELRAAFTPTSEALDAALVTS